MQQKGKHNPTLTPYARELRKNMTKQEKHLWYDFLRFYPVKILRQKVIGKYIADFYCPKAKLIIEIDGSQHYEKDAVKYDKNRTEAFEELDMRVIRFSNHEIDYNFKSVCEKINLKIIELSR